MGPQSYLGWLGLLVKSFTKSVATNIPPGAIADTRGH